MQTRGESGANKIDLHHKLLTKVGNTLNVNMKKKNEERRGGEYTRVAKVREQGREKTCVCTNTCNSSTRKYFDVSR